MILTEETTTTLLTIDEAAKLLRVSGMTIRRMVKAGQLEGVKVRNQWRVKKDSVDKYLV